MYYLVFCSAFIVVPWVSNLVFLVNLKKNWEENDESPSSVTEWLNKYSSILVLLCMFSGGAVPSLNIVNSNLFGLTIFNMGLAKYKQIESIRHRVWLTVIMENVPQIIIGIVYGFSRHSFNNLAILFSLTSSILSLLFFIFSTRLSYPKHFYIYKMTVKLKKQEDKLKEKLRYTNRIANAICDGLDEDHGFCFVENIHILRSDRSKFSCNVVTYKELPRVTSRKRQSIVDELNRSKRIKFRVNSVRVKSVSYESVTLCSYCDHSSIKTCKTLVSKICKRNSNETDLTEIQSTTNTRNNGNENENENDPNEENKENKENEENNNEAPGMQVTVDNIDPLSESHSPPESPRRPHVQSGAHSPHSPHSALSPRSMFSLHSLHSLQSLETQGSVDIVFESNNSNDHDHDHDEKKAELELEYGLHLEEWEQWDTDQVSNWIRNVLMEHKIRKSDMDKFMDDTFNPMSITGRSLKTLAKNSQYAQKFQEKIGHHPFGIVIAVQTAIESLRHEPHQV